MRLVCLVIFAFAAVQCTLFQKSVQDTDDSLARGPNAAGDVIDASGYAYNTNLTAQTSCDGYPKLKVQTLPGTCLGFVTGKSQNHFKMPRTILALSASDYLVVDMGSWNPKTGALFWMKESTDKKITVQRLKKDLNTPHGIALSSDGYIYLAENEKITRFHFNAGTITDEELVIGNLPAMADHMHPLTQIVFNPVNNDLFINSGAPTDHCQGDEGKVCSDADQMASIRKITGEQLKNIPKGGITETFRVAQGLRNSMALAVPPSGDYLIQGENSRDFPELEEPYEEMNVIYLRSDLQGLFHYGWPYCYNLHATAPEWGFLENANSALKAEHPPQLFDCGLTNINELAKTKFQLYKRPQSLIPPHAAPLHAAYYEGEMFKDLLGGKLLMSWHGYRPTGQRFVAYDTKADGWPKVFQPTGNETYNNNQPNGCAKPAPFKPRGGFRKHSPYTEIISGWAPIKNVRPKGAPTGFDFAADGSIWIVDDKNKSILRLAKSATVNHQDACGGGTPAPVDSDPNIPLLVWRNLVKESPTSLALYTRFQNKLFPSDDLIKQEKPVGYCVSCHENFRVKDLKENSDVYSMLDYLVRYAWVKPRNLAGSPLYNAVSHGGSVPAMPPANGPQFFGTPEGDAIIQSVKSWIEDLPIDIDDRGTPVKIELAKKTSTLNIRDRAGTKDTTICGRFLDGDVAYIDARASAKITKDDVQWRKVFMVPGHTRLFIDKCTWPLDGVFYISHK